MEDCKTCTFPEHHKTNSLYPKNKVPISEFMKTYNNGSVKIFMRCSSCRYYKSMPKDIGYNHKLKYLDIKEHVNNNPHLYIYTKVCVCSSHLKYSIHPKLTVPIHLFRENVHDINSKLYNNCLDCRENRMLLDKIVKKKKVMIVIDNMFWCKCCSRHKINDERYICNDIIYNTCMECIRQRKKAYKKKKLTYNNIKHETILNNGSSCEKCQCIFIKNLNNEFHLIKIKVFIRDGVKKLMYNNIEYDAFEFIKKYKNELEIEILEFDHLTEQEQRERGKLTENDVYVPKKGNVSQLGSERLIRYEVVKCQLVCHECHVYDTISREKIDKRKKSGVRKLKYDYVVSIKNRGCTLCGYINTDLPRFFDMDHINPQDKYKGIAILTEDINCDFLTFKNECYKCRVLCRYCHIIHTRNQIYNGVKFIKII